MRRLFGSASVAELQQHLRVLIEGLNSAVNAETRRLGPTSSAWTSGDTFNAVKKAKRALNKTIRNLTNRVNVFGFLLPMAAGLAKCSLLNAVQTDPNLRAANKALMAAFRGLPNSVHTCRIQERRLLPPNCQSKNAETRLRNCILHLGAGLRSAQQECDQRLKQLRQVRIGGLTFWAVEDVRVQLRLAIQGLDTLVSAASEPAIEAVLDGVSRLHAVQDSPELTAACCTLWDDRKLIQLTIGTNLRRLLSPEEEVAILRKRVARQAAQIAKQHADTERIAPLTRELERLRPEVTRQAKHITLQGTEIERLRAALADQKRMTRRACSDYVELQRVTEAAEAAIRPAVKAEITEAAPVHLTWLYGNGSYQEGRGVGAAADTGRPLSRA